ERLWILDASGALEGRGALERPVAEVVGDEVPEVTDQLDDPTSLVRRERAGAHAGDGESPGQPEALGLGLRTDSGAQGVEPLIGDHLRGVDSGIRAAPSPPDLDRGETKHLAPLDDVLDGVVLGRGDEDPVGGFDALVLELSEATLDRGDHL